MKDWLYDDKKIPYLDPFVHWLERQLCKPRLIWVVLMGRGLVEDRRKVDAKQTELPTIIKRPENTYAPIAAFLVNMQMDLHEAISKTEKGRLLIFKQAGVLERCLRAEIPITAITRPKGGAIIPKLKEDGKIKTSIELSEGKLLPDRVWDGLRDQEIKTVILMGVDADGNLQSMAEQLMNRKYKVLLCAELATNNPDFKLKDRLQPYHWYAKKQCFFPYLSSIWDFIR